MPCPDPGHTYLTLLSMSFFDQCGQKSTVPKWRANPNNGTQVGSLIYPGRPGVPPHSASLTRILQASRDYTSANLPQVTSKKTSKSLQTLPASPCLPMLPLNPINLCKLEPKPLSISANSPLVTLYPSEPSHYPGYVVTPPRYTCAQRQPNLVTR